MIAWNFLTSGWRGARWLAIAGLLGGTATAQIIDSNRTGNDDDSLAPLASPSVGISSNYRIAPSDILYIEVFQEPDLTREMRVSASGDITYPLLGQLNVAGRTAAEVEQDIRRQLAKDYIVDPHVLVTVKEFRQRRVAVQGQVNRPSLIELPAEQKMTILQAISVAGGFTRLAKKDQIRLIRPGQPERTFSEEELIRNTDPEKTFYLQPDDVIIVGERFF